MFDKVPITLYEALLVVSFLNGLVLLVGSGASEAERAQRKGLPDPDTTRRLPTPQFLFSAVLVVLPFLVLGGLAAAVSTAFLLQLGWVYHSSGTEGWMLVVSLLTATLALGFAISHSHSSASRRRKSVRYLTNFYQMVDRVAVVAGYASGSVSLLVIFLSAAFGAGPLVG
jgi:hypothetical protein